MNQVMLGPLGPFILWLVFLFMLAWFVIYGLVLLYHWNKYALNASVSSLALVTYVLAGAVLLGMMFLSAMALSF